MPSAVFFKYDHLATLVQEPAVNSASHVLKSLESSYSRRCCWTATSLVECHCQQCNLCWGWWLWHWLLFCWILRCDCFRMCPGIKCCAELCVCVRAHVCVCAWCSVSSLYVFVLLYSHRLQYATVFWQIITIVHTLHFLIIVEWKVYHFRGVSRICVKIEAAQLNNLTDHIRLTD